MKQSTRDFDGIICFGGGDWWYHNRGHYDMQLCREFSRRLPVLYINSLGIRIPAVREGAMFLKRVSRKLDSFRRGFVRIDPRFAVVSPIFVPAFGGSAISRTVLAPQVRAAARRMGITRPLVWVTCPPAADVLPYLPVAALVYQRTDRWESYPEADPQRILAYHATLSKRADLTLFCSTLLMREEGPACRRPVYVDHGVDIDRFARAAEAGSEPPDMAGIPSPRAGFVGGIDASTFDPDLFDRVVGLLPEVHFVLVGACSLSRSWQHANVWMLGQKPYETVASYMAACDVLLMPWNRSDWIRACNPIKLKEYLAVGRPIVSTPFVELEQYQGLVSVAEDAEAFARAIEAALAHPGDAGPRRDRVRGHTWQDKAAAVLDLLGRSGIRPATEEPKGELAH